MEYFEFAVRLIFGGQMVFWGLNGFFNWKEFPAPTARFEKFVAGCFELKGLMPLVKILEIVAGLMTFFNFQTPVALLVLAPILTVITMLHVFHNPKPAGVLITTVLPYLILIAFYYSKFSVLF